MLKQLGILLALLSALMVSGTSSHAESNPRSGTAIQINADRGEYDSRLNTHRLWGNVRIQHGTLLVLADEGTAYRAGDNDERIELQGAPARWTMTMEDGTEAEGESEQIIYNLNSEVITMIGQAQVRDHRGTFTGAQLSYSLVTETMIGEGGVELFIEPPQD
jgi:lipopolysaccharide export system protein LptA